MSVLDKLKLLLWQDKRTWWERAVDSIKALLPIKRPMSKVLPVYNDIELYSDSDLEYQPCQIGVREVATLIREVLAGATKAKRLSARKLDDTIAGDLFEVEIKNYVLTFFVDDPGTWDYIETVTCGERMSRYADWIVEPESLLSEFETVRLDNLLERL